MGFEGFGMLLCTQPFGQLSEVQSPHFAYLELVEDIHYQSGAELGDHYAAAIESDAKIIDMTSPRGYWDAGATPAAESVARQALTDLKSRKPLYQTGIAGLGYYACFPL